MDNYIIGLLPVVPVTGDMKIAIGGVLGSVTVDQLKEFITNSNSGSTGLTLNPSAVTISANDLVNIGVNFKISGSSIPDQGYHWLISGDVEESNLSQSYSDNQDTLELKLKAIDSISSYPAVIKIQAGDENWNDEQFATITVTQ